MTLKISGKYLQAHMAQRAGDYVRGYVRDSAAGMLTKLTIKDG